MARWKGLYILVSGEGRDGENYAGPPRAAKRLIVSSAIFPVLLTVRIWVDFFMSSIP